MTRLYEFACSTCGYEAYVSGGEGKVNGQRPTTTKICIDCKHLFEMRLPVIAMGGTFDIGPGAHKSQCPHGQDHPISDWCHPGPCPKCGLEMQRREKVSLPDGWGE
jgi:hypothetical protein